MEFMDLLPELYLTSLGGGGWAVDIGTLVGDYIGDLLFRIRSSNFIPENLWLELVAACRPDRRSSLTLAPVVNYASRFRVMTSTLSVGMGAAREHGQAARD